MHVHILPEASFAQTHILANFASAILSRTKNRDLL